jgi:hypothetical protein
VTVPVDIATMLDPAEYRVDPVSEDAGETIFAHTGIGDPYRTGIPYPIYLALLARYPDLLGETPQASAARFGSSPASPTPRATTGMPARACRWERT